jgi:hypothetical protein
VFLTALPSLRLTATRAEVRSYLTATARTVLAGHWRRRFGLEITSIDVAEVEAAAVATAGEPAPAGWPLLERILARLPERYRAVLELLPARAQRARGGRGTGHLGRRAGVIQRALRMAAELGRDDPAGDAGAARDNGAGGGDEPGRQLRGAGAAGPEATAVRPEPADVGRCGWRSSCGRPPAMGAQRRVHRRLRGELAARLGSQAGRCSGGPAAGAGPAGRGGRGGLAAAVSQPGVTWPGAARSAVLEVPVPGAEPVLRRPPAPGRP